MAKEKKPIWKRWWFWVLIIIIIIGFASCGGDDENTDTQQQAEKQSETTTKKDETKEEVVSIGQPVKSGDFEYVVKNSSETNEITSDNEFIDSKTTTGKFIAVDYSIKNLDSEARMVDAELFRIKSGGNEYMPMQDADIMMLLGDANLFLEEVNPQMSKDGKLYLKYLPI